MQELQRHGNVLTSSQEAFFSAHFSIELRRATLGVRVIGAASTVPVAGQVLCPPASHRSMYRRSYLQHDIETNKTRVPLG